MQTPTNPHIWITRPDGRGNELCDSLQLSGYKIVKQPVIQINHLSVDAAQKEQLEETSTLVFTSVYAVESLFEQLPDSGINKVMIAIGNATAKAVQKAFSSDDVLTPETPNSEGLLTLVNNLGIAELTICKGAGGRNMLESALIEDGINVEEINLYHRSTVKIDAELSQQWQQQGVNFILATSNEIADSIYQQCDSSWLNNCHWIVASDRISRHIRKKGAGNISVANSASDADMLAAVKEC